MTKEHDLKRNGVSFVALVMCSNTPITTHLYGNLTTHIIYLFKIYYKVMSLNTDVRTSSIAC